MKLARLSAVFFVALGLLASVCVIELALRLVEPVSYNTQMHDPQSGLLTYIPGTQFTESTNCYDNTVDINAAGFHAPPFPPAAKPAGTYRIVVVGSSFVEGLQVPTEALFSTQLEHLLNTNPARTQTYQVIPIGFSGNGTFLNLLYYLRYGAPLHPDLVIELATENELTANAAGTTYPPQFDAHGVLIERLPTEATNPRIIHLKELMRKSHLAMTLYPRFVTVISALRAYEAHPTFLGHSFKPEAPQSATSSSAGAWEEEAKLFDAFSSRLATGHIPFVLASWASPYAASTTVADLPPHFAAIAAHDRFFYINLAPSIAAQAQTSGADITWSCDGHWNETGHQYAAQALYAFLMAHPELH
jgi:hypothetical protein